MSNSDFSCRKQTLEANRARIGLDQIGTAPLPFRLMEKKDFGINVVVTARAMDTTSPQSPPAKIKPGS